MFSSKSFIVSGLTFRSLIHFELVNHMPAMQETWVRFLSREDPLEKEMAAHSSILVWRIPWTEEPGVLQSMGPQKVRHDLATEKQQASFKSVHSDPLSIFKIRLSAFLLLL